MPFYTKSLRYLARTRVLSFCVLGCFSSMSAIYPSTMNSTFAQEIRGSSDVYNCLNQRPRSATDIVELNYYIKTCAKAYSINSSPEMSNRFGWALMQMAYYEYYFQALSDMKYIENARILFQSARRNGFSSSRYITDLNNLESIQLAYERKVGRRKPGFGADRSLSALCLLGQPQNPNNRTGSLSYLGICATAYNARPNGLLAANYARANLIVAAQKYNVGDINIDIYLSNFEKFMAISAREGWEESTDLTNYARQLRNLVSLKKKKSQNDSNAVELAIGAAAVAAIMYYFFNQNSNFGASQYDERRSSEYDLDRIRNSPGSVAPAAESQRTYGLYGNCPQPGAGYGC
jgi:hypothetical protein